MVLMDKVIVVTGASDGIGKALAEKLAGQHAKLALIGRDQAKLQACLKALGGVEAKSYICDIGDKAVVQKTIEEIAGDFGGIDILINNAGIWQKMDDFSKLSTDAIDEVIDVNLKGTMYVTRAALEYIGADGKEGIIFNVVSKSGIVAQSGQSAYTASKYGLRGFTDVLRQELVDTHVHVGALYQSGTNTGMFKKVGDDVPLAIFTEPEDLADTIVHALSRPPKMWITELRVNYHA